VHKSLKREPVGLPDPALMRRGRCIGLLHKTRIIETEPCSIGHSSGMHSSSRATDIAPFEP